MPGNGRQPPELSPEGVRSLLGQPPSIEVLFKGDGVSLGGDRGSKIELTTPEFADLTNGVLPMVALGRESLTFAP